MMLRFCVILGVAVSVCLAVSVNDCPANLPRNQYLRTFGNRCYQFVLDHTREFDDAENECRARGGHLVIIRDIATQRFLYNTLRQDLGHDDIVWIGLSDQASEGHFLWGDGTPAKFTYWASGQPGEFGSLEDCVAMDTREEGRWHDYSCSDWFFSSHHENFICEFPLVEHSSPASPVRPSSAPSS
ncbi:ladderlectin-like [Babylonia areolata]|uniref:ladderlectin-like n=1 Tax=Babylonia areolata TaxID=304850 RepID=UPI003FD4B1AE